MKILLKIKIFNKKIVLRWIFLEILLKIKIFNKKSDLRWNFM